MVNITKIIPELFDFGGLSAMVSSNEALRLYSETKLPLILDSNSSKYRSSVVGVGLARV